MGSNEVFTEALRVGLDIENMSLAELLALDAEAAEEFYEGLTLEEWAALQYTWEHWARPKQLEPPGDWFYWLLLTGRGFGKSRAAAEFVRGRVKRREARRIGVLAPTASVARDVVVEGESGILEACPPWDRPKFYSTKRRLVWKNGATLTYYSSEEPDLLRGAQFDTFWIEELCAIKNARKCWDLLIPAIRLGRPKVVITTTPKRRHVILQQLLDRMAAGKVKIHLTRGSTWENKANLAADSLIELESLFAGTNIGRQELEGEVLSEVEGAIWTEALLESDRVKEAPPLVKVVAGIDPAVSDNKRSDENGIVVGGLDAQGHTYVLGDYTLAGGPDDWGKALVRACREHRVTHIKVETVRGGNLVRRNIETIFAEADFELPPISEINSQELDKLGRVELFFGLYETHRVHHVGKLPGLEEEMTTWNPRETKYSPNRIDGLINVLSELYPEREKSVKITSAKPIEVSPGAYAPKRPMGRASQFRRSF